jgi:D-alanyl-D-alanine carboxypeptidase (penicillin-binding protein 5/6)
VAQSFFEPPGMSDKIEPSMQQGDTEQGSKVYLASSPPPGRASSIQIVEPKSVPKLNGKARAKPGGQWIVQVGSFNKRSDAREQLAIVEKRFGKHFDDARPIAEKDRGKYRARFSGFSEKDAREACRVLKAKRTPCLVMAPRG